MILLGWEIRKINEKNIRIVRKALPRRDPIELHAKVYTGNESPCIIPDNFTV